MYRSFRATPIACIFLFFLACTPLFAQAPVRFIAAVDARKVATGSLVEITYTLENASGSRFSPPAFTGLKLMDGPSTGMSTTIINGKYSQSMTWTFGLQTIKPGLVNIAEASVMANGKLLKSNTLQIEVVPGKAAAPAGTSKGAANPSLAKDDLFITMELDKKKAYVGEQVLLSFKLYTAVNVESYDIIAEPRLEGFFQKEMRRFDSRANRERVGNREYVTKVLKTTAIFPQQTGTMEIGPLRIQLGVQRAGGGRDPLSIFFGQRVEPVSVEADPVSLVVMPLPEPAPPAFSGAVGTYKLSAAIDRNQVSTDESLSLALTVEGTGDPKRFSPPKLVFSDGLEVYDPKIVAEDEWEDGAQWTFSKKLEYFILPQKPGEYRIVPEITAFDPDSNRYVIRKNDKPVVFSVSQGTGASQKKSRPGADDAIQTDTQLTNIGDFLVHKPLYWLLFCLPILGLAGYWLFEKNKIRRASLQADHSWHKGDTIQERLAPVKKQYELQHARGFYDALLHTLQQYLSYAFGMTHDTLSAAEASQKLHENGVPTETQELMMGLWRQCEMALFAGQANPATMDDAWVKAQKVLTELEKHRKMGG